MARLKTTAVECEARPAADSHGRSIDIPALFAVRGLRCTRQRVRIFSALADSKSHPTAEELHGMIGAGATFLARPLAHESDADDPQSVSLATVYNTLETLCRAGLAKRLPSASVASIGATGGGARYEADLHEHLHLTLADGGVVDVPEDLSAKLLASIRPELVREVERRMGVRIARIRVDLFQADAENVASIGQRSW